MKLQSLELKGFKSFANETVINFNEDIIGVVGPNGSGKSNVVDAIRWVLGEQKSKELRLDKMTSVIFNGSKKRKQGGLASVSLTFENTKNILPTEYQTVKITRMLYRSGESEYRLNNVPCRLKDITSLFLDTGIGSNSYAIISLGMVDDLLQDKNNSRRQMFEQASGISKYKKRKHETLLKLKNTTEDLDRVQDLLFEIEGNLKTLEKQAKRTRRFYEIKADYKTLSVDLAIHKLASYKDRHGSVKTNLQTEEDNFRQLEVQMRQLEADLENDKKGNLDKEKALSERQRELNELVNKLRTMENDKRMMEQKVQFIQQNEIKLTQQIESAKIRKEQLDKDIVTYRSDLNAEKKLEADLEKELVEAEQHLAKIQEDHGALKADLDEVLGKQQALEKEVFEFEKQKAINHSQINNLQKDLERSEIEIEDKITERNAVSERLNDLAVSEQEQSLVIEKLVKEEAVRQTEIESTQTKFDELTKKVADINRKLDSSRNEFNLTKSLVDNLEGFPESIKFLSNSKDWKKDTPLFSDIIYVEEAYRVAIENYLEPFLNYYVVQSYKDAFDAIKLLGKTQKGKANFFVLDAFKNYQAPMVMLPDTQRAIDLITVDMEYQNLVNYLLENVVVTDREELIGTLPENDAVLLSKSGRFVQRRYSVSGGSVGLFEGKRIGRKKNLEVLEITIKKLEKEQDQTGSELYRIEAKLNDLKGEVSTEQIQLEKDKLNKLLQDKASLQTRLENVNEIIKDFDRKNNEGNALVTNLLLTIQSIDSDLVVKNSFLTEAKDHINNTDGSFRKVAEELSQASTHFNQKNIAFIQQQNKVASLQRELSFREKNLDETTLSLKNNQDAIQNAGSEQTEIAASIETIAADLISVYEQKKERETHLTAAEQTYFKARGSINELEDNLRKVNRKTQETQVLINNFKDKFNEIKLELTSISERLKIEFNVEMEDVMKNEPSTKLTQEELQVKVDKLQNRIGNYGDINPMAVEAYDEMNERYVSITTQKDDILAAKSSLLDTIKEIEDTATIQFLDAFEKVRTYFKDVFRSLFSEEDDCDLTLENPEMPLDSAIKIMAKPKGKRPQSISQLSGGEKTLTATALLFSLYLLKPAPFCIFDEVDAPLDDANIEKFNRIIKKFSKDSQFIIVTHNKQTMAAVDVIYGVYMHEQGVSGVSAVDFRELDHTASLVVTDKPV